MFHFGDDLDIQSYGRGPQMMLINCSTLVSCSTLEWNLP